MEIPCPTCDGSGRQPKKRTLQVKIPAGIFDGQAVRVRGEGEPGEGGGPAGDLHVYVRVQPHPFFVRDESNLVMQLLDNKKASKAELDEIRAVLDQLEKGNS